MYSFNGCQQYCPDTKKWMTLILLNGETQSPTNDLSRNPVVGRTLVCAALLSLGAMPPSLFHTIMEHSTGQDGGVWVRVGGGRHFQKHPHTHGL